MYRGMGALGWSPDAVDRTAVGVVASFLGAPDRDVVIRGSRAIGLASDEKDQPTGGMSADGGPYVPPPRYELPDDATWGRGNREARERMDSLLR